MSGDLGNVLAFAAELSRRSVAYRLSVVRPDAMMVEVAVPGERWEIEFFESGDVEVERFRSDGRIGDKGSLDELWKLLE